MLHGKTSLYFLQRMDENCGMLRANIVTVQNLSPNEQGPLTAALLYGDELRLHASHLETRCSNPRALFG
jgi:hypothetical protein